MLVEKYGASLATSEKTAAPTENWFETVRRAALDAMMTQIRADLQALGISHDVFSSEADVYARGEVDRAIKSLEGKGLIYEGVLEPPKAKPRMTGSRGRKPSSDPRLSAMMSIALSRNQMGRTHISPMMWAITARKPARPTS
ncbi:hypothetical protein CGLAMM_09615 [Acetobacteraceae bacterium EV16G]